MHEGKSFCLYQTCFNYVFNHEQITVMETRNVVTNHKTENTNVLHVQLIGSMRKV